MPFHRQIKNVVKNYTEAERKVREATSNDPWGPSSTLMSEIADMTYNVMCFVDIMQMLWKRLNDKNKNWRHVYKSLILMEYVIKTGSEKVAARCRENIHTIETLKDFQYVEEGKDYGLSVRDRAKTLCLLLRDGDTLREERVKALKAKSRLNSSSFASYGSNGSSTHHTMASGAGKGISSLMRSGSLPMKPKHHQRDPPNLPIECFEVAEDANGLGMPMSEGEEHIQLELALAMSREEHEKEEVKRRTEEEREKAKLEMALEQSRLDEEARTRMQAQQDQIIQDQQQPQQFKQQNHPTSTTQIDNSQTNRKLPTPPHFPHHTHNNQASPYPHPSTNNHVNKTPSSSATISSQSSSHKQQLGTSLFHQLIDTSLSAAPANVPDPWSSLMVPEGNLGEQNATNDQSKVLDPWHPPSESSSQNRMSMPIGASAYSPNQLSSSSSSRSLASPQHQKQQQNYSEIDHGAHSNANFGASAHSNFLQSSRIETPRKKQPEDFLGEHKNLVDLNRLVDVHPASTNPFAVGKRSVLYGNPFEQQQSGIPIRSTLPTSNQNPESTSPWSNNIAPSHQPHAIENPSNPFL